MFFPTFHTTWIGKNFVSNRNITIFAKDIGMKIIAIWEILSNMEYWSTTTTS